jgi:hypothetical protein
MDNAYLYGHDYDSYRSHTIRPYEESFSTLSEQAKKRSVHRLRLFLLIGVVCFGLLGYYALRFIPLFDIQKVTFSVSGGFAQVPDQARDLAEQIIGKSLMSGHPRELQKALAGIPVVSDAKVKGRSFSSLEVELHIIEPTTFVAAVSAEDTISGIYFAQDRNLVEIGYADFKAFGNRTFVLEVSESYAEYLTSYGLDTGMIRAISLANQMGLDEAGRYRVIGRIRYEENLETPFGHMILELPAYSSILSIREPVSESRLHDAVLLIKLEHEQNRNIALMGQVRYDLYAQSLVSRY